MSSTVGKEKTRMNKKTMYICLGAGAILVVGLIIAVICTGGFTSPF